MATKPQTPGPADIDGIPTCDGLCTLGREYAYRRDGYIVITDKGHALIGERLAEKAQAARERGEGDWTQPPSRPLIGTSSSSLTSP